MSPKLAISSLVSAVALGCLCLAAASIAPLGDAGAPMAPTGAISAQAPNASDLRD